MEEEVYDTALFSRISTGNGSSCKHLWNSMRQEICKVLCLA